MVAGLISLAQVLKAKSLLDWLLSFFKREYFSVIFSDFHIPVDYLLVLSHFSFFLCCSFFLCLALMAGRWDVCHILVVCVFLYYVGFVLLYC